LQPTSTGKVRDLFDLGDRLLMVATDRISAYDVIFADPIPGKGVLLTQMSIEWFALLRDVIDNHLLSAERRDFPGPFRDVPELEGRTMLVRKARRVDAECIVRGYLSGSGWRDYKRTGGICGIQLPVGLRQSERLDPPLFTPSTKAESGHDENIGRQELERIVGAETAAHVEEASLEIYRRAAEHAREHGIVLADTKFEFGYVGDRLIVIDEVLSPDSSRFWPAESYAVGRAQESFDKQVLRDWVDASGWDHRPPAPALPPEIVERTQGRYIEALRRLFPRALERLPQEVGS
jgi:phosphoribosylaminoimidazole-succinocarboxamide synthase